MRIVSGSAWVHSREVYVDSLNRPRRWQQNRLTIFIIQSQSQVLVELTLLEVRQCWSHEPDPCPQHTYTKGAAWALLSTCTGVIILLSLSQRAGHCAASRNISGILLIAPKGLKSHMLLGVLLPQRTESSHQAKSVPSCGQAGVHGPYVSTANIWPSQSPDFFLGAQRRKSKQTWASL